MHICILNAYRHHAKYFIWNLSLMYSEFSWFSAVGTIILSTAQTRSLGLRSFHPSFQVMQWAWSRASSEMVTLQLLVNLNCMYALHFPNILSIIYNWEFNIRNIQIFRFPWKVKRPDHPELAFLHRKFEVKLVVAPSDTKKIMLVISFWLSSWQQITLIVKPKDTGSTCVVPTRCYISVPPDFLCSTTLGFSPDLEIISPVLF